MAGTFLDPVIEKLIELLAEGVNLLKGLYREVRSLKDELEIIKPFVKDAEEKLQTGELGPAMEIWLNQIREVADHIEDVINEYLHHLAKRHRNEHGFAGPLCKAGDYIRALKPRQNIASEIQDIKETLLEIKERGQTYGLRPFELDSSSKATNANKYEVDPRFGSLFIKEDELVGIDSTSKELVRCLVEGSSARSVVSIVGEGGIGKTTLAQKVYNDEAVKQHFECFAWVNVSQSYDIKKILNIMKNQICPVKEEPMETTEELIDLLRHYLKTKRYVIVFDDVWKLDFWEVVKYALPSNNEGNRIIITTRNTMIAHGVEDTPLDHVQVLKTWPPKLAWELFCKKAFRFELEAGCCPKELEPLSRQIVSKCQGLPLAIVAVAGLLSQKEKTQFEWKRVLDDLSYQFHNNPQLTSVSRIISLSYDDLPYHLKSCFLYFSIFPENLLVWESRLYKLWIAEDFIKTRRDKTLEQVAEEYLSELIHRNLVSVEIKYGFERWCRVHSLIRGVILTRVDKLHFCQIINENKLIFKGKSRRLSINGTTKDVLNVIGDDSKVQSISLFNIDHKLTDSFLTILFRKFNLSKVLDFEDTPLDKLPEEIGNLFNLKYLNLRRTRVKMVPKSIHKLQNLQTLNLLNTLVEELPIEITKLRNLQHLSASLIIFYDSGRGVRTHKGIGNFKELQTLSSVTPYPSPSNLVKELERLNKLKVLSIKHLTAVTMKAFGVVIEKMNQLERLFLASISKDEILDLECISAPPPFLRFLMLECRLQQMPDWIPKLHNLQGLDLRNSRLRSEPLECLKGLPNLTYLQMYQTYEGEELHFEEGGFEKLKQLILRELNGLKMVKIDRGALPLLEELEFKFLGLVREVPNFQHLTNLKSLTMEFMPREFKVGLHQVKGPHYWKIQHVPSVTIS